MSLYLKELWNRITKSTTNHNNSDNISNNNNNAGNKNGGKLSMLALVALIFYEVSGGPFGVEDSVKSGGPLLALLGFTLFPFLWSVPEALVTAELSTAFPENGGYVIWISAAFGHFWGFQDGFWKWFSGVIDNALYPLLFMDYLKHSIPCLGDGVSRKVALLFMTCSLTYMNYRGLAIVGFAAICLAVFSLLPFVALGLFSIGRIKPKRWMVVDLKRTDWRGYLNTLFWNLNFWDKASTLAGEVERPRETFPKALMIAVILVIVSYLVPLLAGTGAFDVDQSRWEDGYFAEVGMLVGGSWLKWWIQAAAALSNMGLFEAEMSTSGFQLLGMSEMGMLPEIFAYRSKYGTPTFSILCSAVGVIGLSWLSFQEIIELVNFLYSLGMILELSAFVWLRIKQPDLPRPYKIPLNTVCVILMCVPPTGLLILVMCLASKKTILVGMSIFIAGLLLYPILEYAKKKRWVKFSEKPIAMSKCDKEKLDIHHEENEVALLTNYHDESPPSELQLINSRRKSSVHS